MCKIYLTKVFRFSPYKYTTCTSEAFWILRNVFYISYIFSSPQRSLIACCLNLKIEFCSCARVASVVWHTFVFHCHWWTSSVKPRLLLSHAGYASWGLSLLPAWSDREFICFKIYITCCIIKWLDNVLQVCN